MLPEFGKILLIFGGIFIVLGLVLLFAPNIPFLGRLPGDIHYKSENFQFYFPIVTCIIISVVLTVILNLFFGGWK